MRILPNRTMRLDSVRVVAGEPAEVSDHSAVLAIRMGWATEAPPAPRAERPSKRAAD